MIAAAELLSASLGSVAPPTLTPAHILVTSAYGVVEIDIGGRRLAGVLDAPGAVVAVGDALTLKVLGNADSNLSYVVDQPEEFTALVIAIDDADVLGTRQLLTPGMGIAVELEPAPRGRFGAKGPALAGAAAAHEEREEREEPEEREAVEEVEEAEEVESPIIVGASLDEALAGLLGDTLEPRPARFGDDEDDDDDVITGSLRRMPLAELVQAMSYARKTAIIRVRVPLGLGIIHLDVGDIVAAQLDDSPHRAMAVRGATAFSRMLACTRGTFRVSFETDPCLQRNVYGSTQMLLLDALRQIDEERRDDEPMELDESDLILEMPEDADGFVRPALKVGRRRVTS